ncbi:hypothetical protein E2C01_078391 [Portunus trituberculatus]|uniref:Uncharacterized protein n=1 Tax=Portunus trituberculatus TaxID=210409 RepID=A0A5B7IQ04_PORTR|nr:hypothetical protein [Portunus trituberculatus]
MEYVGIVSVCGFCNGIVAAGEVQCRRKYKIPKRKMCQCWRVYQYVFLAWWYSLAKTRACSQFGHHLWTGNSDEGNLAQITRKDGQQTLNLPPFLLIPAASSSISPA